MRILHLMAIGSLILLAGCGGGSGDFATDAGIATDASVALDIESRQLIPLGDAGGSGTIRQLVLVRLPAGSATIGRELSDNLVEDIATSDTREQPPSTVVLGECFMATTELTQAQWLAMTGESPWEDLLVATGGGLDAARLVGPDLPAVGMTRAQVEDVCRRFAPSGWRLALPSPEQWERAALAGTSKRFSWGDLTAESLVERHANIWLPSATDPATVLRPRAVGSLLANAFGLYDMHGNVWEMTTAGGSDNVIVCGGAWDQPVLQARASNRMKVPADIGLPTVGVRLLMVRQ
jgi:formylglycine-generating enzyme required for sulfatase activity